jgi:hypothetical protein
MTLTTSPYLTVVGDLMNNVLSVSFVTGLRTLSRSRFANSSFNLAERASGSSMVPAGSVFSWIVRFAGLIVTTRLSGFGSTTRFSCFLGSAGTFASNLLGLTGVMIMKMINSTSKTSIRGVSLIFGVAPSLEPPADIPITSP